LCQICASDVRAGSIKEHENVEQHPSSPSSFGILTAANTRATSSPDAATAANIYAGHITANNTGSKANTRSWAEAEEVKRDLGIQLSGNEPGPKDTGRDIRSAIELFISSKKVQNPTPDLIRNYTLWLGRLASYCEGQGVYTVRGITGEVVIGFRANWEQLYPSTLSRHKPRERYKSFMRFCEVQDWLTKLPA
jgi:hypothetical protein